MILAGDVGGTHARLALFSSAAGGSLALKATRTYPSAGFPGLQEVLAEFLRETGARPRAASLGIAGVIRKGKVEMMVNLPWRPEAAAIARALGMERVHFLNDMEAAAWGVEALGPEGQAELLSGDADSDGNRCLISAGTGLGEAGIVRHPEGYLPFRSEGGHVNFAPRNELESDLLRHLAARFGGHLSYERVCSGPGLVNVYAFLRDTGRGEEPAWLAERIQAGSAGRVITDCALKGESELCSAALDLFVSIYGSAAGNLALKTLATGGVWLGGGIAPRILDRLRGPVFREAFLSKGRLRPMMELIPVKVCIDDRLALLGAAREAFTRSGASRGATASP